MASPQIPNDASHDGVPPQPPKAQLEDGKPLESAQPPYSGFSSWHRRYILLLITIAGFFGPLAGNIYLPALPVLERVFGVSQTAMNATVSSFMAVFAFAPLYWTSLADVNGRRPLYLSSLAIYIAANILIAAVPANFGALVFLRILQAFGSSAVVSMGAGTVADITEPKGRGKAMSRFLLGPQLGPVLGPVLGGAFATETTWRWIFGFLALLGFTVWVIILFMLPETLRCRVGNGEMYREKSWILWPPKITSELAPQSQRGPAPPKPTLKGYWKLFIYPPIGIVSFNTAILYATYFSIAVELPTVLERKYHWRSSEVGAAYLAVGVAMIAGSFIGGYLNDFRRSSLAKRAPDGEVDPESRLTDQIWGVILCAGGSIMFGWCVDQSINPAAVIVATFLTGFGMSWVFVATTAFLSECVAQQAAGAFALGNLLRNPAAAIAAVIAPPLITRMGIAWFYTGLGILDLVVVGGAVMTLNVRGPYWRSQRKAALAVAKK